MINHEVTITQGLYQAISASSGISLLRKVLQGRSLMTNKFKQSVKNWYGGEIPWPLVEPDLILVFEDAKKGMDDVMLVAVEIKYFNQSINKNKKLRQSFREFGQPLRSLLFGFDSVALWHIISDAVADEPKITRYSRIVMDTVQKLRLPMSYFATEIINGDCEVFKVYEPLNQNNCPISTLVGWMGNACADKRNTAVDDDIQIRRRSLKLALNIPT